MANKYGEYGVFWMEAGKKENFIKQCKKLGFIFKEKKYPVPGIFVVSMKTKEFVVSKELI